MTVMASSTVARVLSALCDGSDTPFLFSTLRNLAHEVDQSATHAPVVVAVHARHRQRPGVRVTVPPVALATATRLSPPCSNSSQINTVTSTWLGTAVLLALKSTCNQIFG
jgi:hypothetical protein